MFLSRRQIHSGIDWLLNNASAPVKFLTNRYLCGCNPSTEQMKELWDEVKQDPQVAEFFSKQKKDGSWFAGGSWAANPTYKHKGARGYSCLSPKYVTAVWILPLLGDMGFTVSDSRVKRACEYVIEVGYIFSSYKIPCTHAQCLVALGKVRMSDDPRLKEPYQYLLDQQRSDGGWVWEEHYHKSK